MFEGLYKVSSVIASLNPGLLATEVKVAARTFIQHLKMAESYMHAKIKGAHINMCVCAVCVLRSFRYLKFETSSVICVSNTDIFWQYLQSVLAVCIVEHHIRTCLDPTNFPHLVVSNRGHLDCRTGPEIIERDRLFLNKSQSIKTSLS